jgi:hypothetical protein
MSQVHFKDDTEKLAIRDAYREARRNAAKENEIRRQAALMRDQADLDQFLDGADPAMRTAMIEFLRPFLSFEPIDTLEPSADCPRCGLRRGSVIEHECR